jgi:hypothetical protein
MVVRDEYYVDKDGRKNENVNMKWIINKEKWLKFNCVIFNMRKKNEDNIRIRERLWK